MPATMFNTAETSSVLEYLKTGTTELEIRCVCQLLFLENANVQLQLICKQSEATLAARPETIN